MTAKRTPGATSVEYDGRHTPNPWRFGRVTKGKYRGDFAIIPVNAHTGEVSGPAFCYLAKGREDIQLANAEFIVRACNAHDDLVRALKGVVGANTAFRAKPLGSPTSIARAKQDAQIAAEDRAIAALKKAGAA